MPAASSIISWTSTRGRVDEFDDVQTGVAGLRAQNRDGAYDPTNVTGPYYGNLLPLTQTKINVKHPFDTSYHDIFTGYIEDFDYSRQGPRGAEVDIKLVDGLELLTNAHVTINDLGSFYDIQHVDARIHAALTDAGWAPGLRRIATGNVNCQSMSYAGGTSVLQVIKDAAEAEFPGVGNFFTDKAGYAMFNGRGIRFAPESYPTRVSFWAAGDDAAIQEDPSLLPIYDMTWNFGKDQLYNDIVVAPRLTSGDSYRTIASNHVFASSSIARYGRRSLSYLDLLLLDGSTSGKSGVLEAKDMALYYKNNYAVPRMRVTSIEFRGQMDDGTTALNGALWDFILNVDLGHILTLNTVNPGGGGFAAEDYFIEGITNSVTALNDRIPKWSMNLNLSPRARYASYP